MVIVVKIVMVLEITTIKINGVIVLKGSKQNCDYAFFTKEHTLANN